MMHDSHLILLYNSSKLLFSPFPFEKKKVKSNTTASTSDQMSKEECIAMVTQEKFDKYTAMFGSEEASIKRCQMIKAMNS